MANEVNNRFSIIERADMVIVYGAAGENALRASRLYRQRWPQRRQPHPNTILRCVQRLRDTGSVTPRAEGRGLQVNPQVEDAVLATIEEQPGNSVRHIAQQIGTSPRTVHRILRRQMLHPYHLQPVQQILAADCPQRMRFCRWFLRQCAREMDFATLVCATDEATFTRDGVVNFHNMHIWADENPHGIRETHFQHRFSVNVWAGIIGDFLVGPYFFEGRLTGAVYADFLENQLPHLLDGVPLHIRARMWYLQDGAPPHGTQEVRTILNRKFPQRWIGRFGPVAWPPRTPDLNPMDFYFWGHIKSLVYSEPINTEQELRDRILVAADTIRATPGIWENVRQNWVRRCQACVRANGDQFQHFL